MHKIDPILLEPSETNDSEFLVFMREQADLSGANKILDGIAKRQYVYETLVKTASITQAPVRAILESKNIEYRAFWIANLIWVKGDQQLLKELAKMQEVKNIYANPRVKLSIFPINATLHVQKADGIEWNIQKINAPVLWNAGFTGQGVVIGGQDTGYDWDHPALKAQYRGWVETNLENPDHNYNWHDAIHSGASDCGVDSLEPCDDHGHGTHTMGTMVGDDGAGHQIGVAPGARWIGCRNMVEGVGTPASYTECYQWFMAPTDLNNANPDPSMAPDIINNSWSCPTNEGCTEPEILQQVVENVHAAGILTVHSAGNSGPDCYTVNTPAAIYAASFTVAATDSNDQIASFSSRGSVKVDGSYRMKPDVAAPGVNILSAIRGGGYGTMSGTSMAAPHVAGMAALMLSAYPQLNGNVDGLSDLIRHSASGKTTSNSCDGDGNLIPNNTYGWGRVDAWSAYTQLQPIHFYFPLVQR